MPKIAFKPENRVAKTNYDYPKLKLKKDERAKIVLLEEPTVEYVHTLRKPRIVDGAPVMFTDKRKDGTEFENYVMDFVSRPISLGDFTTLEKDGLDVKNCPISRFAKDHPDWVQKPQRRYAMHVIRYRTKAGSFTIQKPFAPETLVWSFTDKVFNQIIDFQEQWADAGGLQAHDLNLGPCTIEKFQQFDINVDPKAAYLDNGDAAKELTLETFKEGQIPDLAIACGSRKEERWIEQDLADIEEAWKAVEAYEARKSGASIALEDVSTALDEPASPEEEITTLLDSGDTDADTTESDASEDGEEEDFDSLIASMSK